MAYLTYSDFIELREKIFSTKLSFFFGKLTFNSQKRVQSHWNAGELPPSNWWNIPLVRKRWNEKITGYADKSYVDYVLEKYLSTKSNLMMFSIGCGTGTQEISFWETGKFSKIDAIDIASNNIQFAKSRVSSSELNFIHSSFEQYYSDYKYDLILFHSSLHHLSRLDSVLLKVKSMLKKDGILVIHEYTGPDRINWNKEQLKCSNLLLQMIPMEKRRYQSGYIKKRQTAPGKLRMIFSDPSEAVESSLILPFLQRHFKKLELKNYGGNILVPLLKGISHHLIEESNENTLLLKKLFVEEDKFLETNRADYHFGVYTCV